MYYRHPDYFDAERLTRALRAMPEQAPPSEVGKLFIVMALVAAPIFAFFLIICPRL